MTEDEAKQKWCPEVRVTLYVRGNLPNHEQPVALVGHGSNKLITDDVELQKRIGEVIEQTGATRCIGSRCMAWAPRVRDDKHPCSKMRD
jgi:hypothetical protein